MAKKLNERYWRRFLLPGEQLLHTFSVSWWYLFLFWVIPGLVTLAGALYALLMIHLILGSLLLLVPLIFLLPAWVVATFTHYAITDHRVMSRVGFLHRRFVTVDLRAITDVYIHEGFIERLLTRTGIIAINTAGSDRVELVLHHVSRPFDRRQDVYKHQQGLMTNEGQENSKVG